MRDGSYYAGLGLAGPIVLCEDFMVDVIRRLLAEPDLSPQGVRIVGHLMSALRSTHPECFDSKESPDGP